MQDDWRTAEGAELSATAMRILDASHACFESKGIQKTSIDDIAESSGISRQTVYRYFNGKQAILEAIALREMLSLGREIRRRVPRSGAFDERLTEALFVSIELGQDNSYVRLIINDQAMMRSCFAHGGHLYRWEQEQWQSFIASARRSGDLASDIDDGGVVRWLVMSQLMLLLMAERLPDWGSHTRQFIRRFLVDPILAKSKGSTASHDPKVRSDIAMIRTMLEQQFDIVKKLADRDSFR